MSSCFSQLKLACFFKAATICMYWRPRCSRNMGGLAEYESGRFRLPKSLQEDSLFVHSNTKSTGYKDKQFASKNSLQLIREVCSKIMMFTVYKVFKKKRRTKIVKDVKFNDYEMSVVVNKFPEL